MMKSTLSPVVLVAAFCISACADDAGSVSEVSAERLSACATPPTAGDFRVLLEGSPLDAVAVDVDPIEIETHDVTQSNDTTWRSFKSGMPKFGQVRLTFRPGASNSAAVAWFEEVRKGRNIRKDITIKLQSKGVAARTYALVDTFPITFSGDTVTLQIGRIEVSTSDAESNASSSGCSAEADQVLRYKGFNVEISGHGAASSDVGWKSVKGGEPSVEPAEATIGSDGERRFTPGKAYVTDLTLVGYMTPQRVALNRWLAATLAGTGDRRSDVIVRAGDNDGGTSRAKHYLNGLITRIEIPKLRAGSADPIEEVVVIKPERYRAD
jgi:hypothetical protein